MKSKAYIEQLNSSRQYTRKELYNAFAGTSSDYSYNTFNWDLRDMLSAGEIHRTGRNSYRVGTSSRKPYSPVYSPECEKIVAFMERSYPDTEYSLFETSMLNEFLNHQIAQNTIFLYVERELGEFVFRDIQSAIDGNILYKPRKDDLRKYWKPGSIIIIDRISEAPGRKDCRYGSPIEKILVDLVSDPSLRYMYSKSEYPDILRNAGDKYYIDSKKMLRYARRRGKASEIEEIMTDGGIDFDNT